MPLTRAKKETVVAEVSDLLADAKMTVVAAYQGTPVKNLQALRRQAKANNTTIKVVKNRLVIQALKQQDKLAKVETSGLEGMLLYAFNSEDEVAPAQSLAEFAKTNPTISFVGAISSDGSWLDSQTVTALAALPSKPVMVASVVSLLQSPVRNVISSIGSALPNILSGLEQKANA